MKYKGDAMKMENYHSSNNSFVKMSQEKVKGLAGRAPDLTAEAMQFNAHMIINGGHAQNLARTLTSDIDHKAFPVK